MVKIVNDVDIGCLPLGCGGLLILALVGVCAIRNQPDPYVTYAPQIAEQSVQDELAARMKDPSSVQFRSVRRAEHDGVWYVCGEFNAKNSFGAYTGFESFAGTRGEIIVASEAKGARLDRFNELAAKCR